MQHIESRLERLEQQNRRLRAGLHAVVLVAVAVLVSGAAGAGSVDLIQARRIQIVDDRGRALVVLGEEGGQGFAALLDAVGNYKVQLNAALSGGTVSVKNQRGQDLIVLGYDAAGNGNVRTASAAGAPLAEIGSSEGGGSVITYDGSGHEHVKLGTTYSGAGAVTTFAADGHRLCSLTATTTGDGLLAAFDSSGRVRASWP